MTPAKVEESLLERDLVMLHRYAQKWMLPTRRLQMQIARLCQITAANPSASLGAYLFDPPEPIGPESEGETAAPAAMDAAVFDSGGGVFVLGRGRKPEEQEG